MCLAKYLVCAKCIVSHNREKLTKAVTGGGATKNYVGGIEYLGANLEAIYFGEGRCTPNGATKFYYYYTVKDHLGNARVNFRADSLAISNTESMHYYPFGMLMEGIGTNTPTNDYTYNYKELNEDFGLNLYDYGARWYDASVGRWWSKDPLGEKYFQWSPYHMEYNNPLRYIDYNGKEIIITIKETDENGKEKSSTVTYNDGKFYDSDGEEYTKGNSFLSEVKETFDYLEQSDFAKTAINRVADDPENSIEIHQQKHAYMENDDNSIGYPTDAGLYWEEDGEDKEQTPALGLFHEIGHSYYEFYGKKESSDKNKAEEEWVLQEFEAKAASDLHEPSRKKHEQGTPYRTNGPTTVAQYEKPKKSKKN